jgi:hypothetical protein
MSKKKGKTYRTDLIRKYVDEKYKDKKYPGDRPLAQELIIKYPTWDLEQTRKLVQHTMGRNGVMGKIKNPILKTYYKVTSDKKVSKFHWRDPIKPLQDLKKVFDAGKGSQDHARWSIKTKEDICIVNFADGHFGSWATDYDQFVSITEEIINTPNLYVMLLGDLLQMSIKLRGVLEVSDNALPPKWQMKFLESWLMEIKHKVICSTWDNHSVMREENASGFSMYADIFQRHVIYHDNIGHVDVHVNDQVYKIAVSHFFRGRTMLNPCHGQMRYMRMTANDREVCMAGDSHVPGIVEYEEGGLKRVAINCGSLQNGGYGKRFFSLHHSPVFPCIVLSGKEHNVTTYWSVKDWLSKK